MRRAVVIFVITAFAFLLRAHLLGAQELRGDEGFSWNYVQDSPGEILARIIREGDPQPPVHYWLLWAWVRLTGDTEFAMRAWSALLSVLLVPLMYRMGRALWPSGGRPVGVLAAGLTAIHPQQIWLAQDARNMYLLALIALALATLILPGLVRHGGWGRWAGYVACGLFAMYSHYYAIFALAAHGAYVVAAAPRSNGKAFKPLWQWIGAGLAIAALVAPWAVVILPVYARGQLADPGTLSLGDYTAAVLGDLAAGPAFPAGTKLVVAFLFGAVGLIPLADSKVPRPYLLAAVILPFIGIYGVVALRSTFNAFYFVIAFPAAYLLAAGGAARLYARFRPLGATVVVVAGLVFAAGLRNHYADPAFSKSRGMREVAARLAEAARPGDTYLANFPDPAQVYYLRHLSLPYHMLPGMPSFEPARVDGELSRLLGRSGSRVWFVPVNAAQWDSGAYVQNRLLGTALLAEDDWFNKMRLMLFLPPSAAQPLNASFDVGIDLVGYHYRPGRLSLVWTAGRPPAENYTVFVHALAADGYNVVSHDAPPGLPTSQWRPGELIVDVHELAVPADQTLDLVAGLYLPATGERVRLLTAAFGERDAALITTLPQQP